MGNRRQSLNMAAHDMTDRFGFGFTELGEFMGHM